MCRRDIRGSGVAPAVNARVYCGRYEGTVNRGEVFVVGRVSVCSYCWALDVYDFSKERREWGLVRGVC